MSLDGRVAIITGASRGLGEAIAERFAGEGADVLLTARDAAALQAVAERLARARTRSDQRIGHLVADVGSPEDTQRMADLALATHGRIDVLVCNAGVYGPIGRIEDVDWTEWVRAVEINLHGTVLSCRAVLPAMRRQRSGKIVILSGGGATRPLPRFSAYAASKAAVARLAETLAEEVADSGIEVNAVAPGSLNTRLLDQVLEAGPDRAGNAFYQQSLRQQQQGGTPLETPAALVAFLASSASDGITGRLISAVWDSWADLPGCRERLAGSDVYTLRRIVPADRGWEAR